MRAKHGSFTVILLEEEGGGWLIEFSSACSITLAAKWEVVSQLFEGVESRRTFAISHGDYGLYSF
jgi:hypothetical protein